MKNYHQPDLYDSGKRMANPDYIEGCRGTRLIQRLKMPHELKGPDVWGFGGGLLHGGLNDKAWEQISGVCSFDYMGASEFELGNLPKAIDKMVKEASSLEAYPLVVTGCAELPFGRHRFSQYDYDAREKVRESIELSTTVFVLAPKGIRPHVDSVIAALAKDEDSVRLKEMSHLRRTIFCPWYWTESKEDEWLYRDTTQGWIELDNGYMFFASEDMWLEFCRLFGVTVANWPDVNIVRPNFKRVEEAMEALRANA